MVIQKYDEANIMKEKDPQQLTEIITHAPNQATEQVPQERIGECGDIMAMNNEIRSRKRTRNIIEHLAHWGTFLSALFTLVAVIVAYATFKENLNIQKEVAAINIYSEYLKQVSSNKNFIDSGYIKKIKKDSKEYKSYYIFASYAMFAAESLYTLGHEDNAWLRTIDLILEPHLSAFSVDDLDASSYDSEYYKYLRKLPDRLK
jgi:hypothetical protein